MRSVYAKLQNRIASDQPLSVGRNLATSGNSSGLSVKCGSIKFFDFKNLIETPLKTRIFLPSKFVQLGYLMNITA